MQEWTTCFSANGGEVQVHVAATFRGWTIERPLGRGRLCQSWLASRGTEKAVVRVLREQFAVDAQARAEWERANWAANRFHHARVVKVIDQGIDSRGSPVIVRGWANGESLEEVLRRGRWDPFSALRFVEQILDALEMAHAHGIVHGRVSPTNVVVTPRGSARLVDFATTPGLQVRKPDQVDVLASARIGPFTPPEGQVSPSAPPSEALDVWSVGACLYFALVGTSPLDSHEDLARVLVQHGDGSTGARGQEFFDDVVAVVRLALTPDPQGRYDSAYAMLGDVRRLLSGRKPKLDGAFAPVPTQSASLRAELPPPSSGLRGQYGMDPQPAQRPTSEWRGNILLMAAIALLVAMATFVMVRERLAEQPPDLGHVTTQ
jgi:eukaryotic-like serine/threonine-protein kinase